LGFYNGLLAHEDWKEKTAELPFNGLWSKSNSTFIFSPIIFGLRIYSGLKLQLVSRICFRCHCSNIWMIYVVLENFCGRVKSLIFTNTKGELVSSCYYPKPWLHFECLNLLHDKRFSIHLALLDVKILYANHHYEIWADRWRVLKVCISFQIIKTL